MELVSASAIERPGHMTASVERLHALRRGFRQSGLWEAQ